MGSPIPDAHKPDLPAEQITLTYYDGTSRTVYDTGIERPYPDGKLIVSRTDLDGIITHVNDAFVEISGYSVDELIGQPQSILRHPDMPKAAYKDLWDTAESGRKWHGYVKNLCKDGSHYWVYATVVPNVRRGETVGYTSVRRKPSRSKIEAALSQYAQMKQHEEG
ncbi:PAS domain-containing protein [Psychrobacter sp. Ps6]|uniref:PAS domain-containing protein n=1 Tax=Psychrobacter sp. Ps6 TaxID=2790960 RepID=UPI001EDE9A55|nr:PAS domain-containing protein [Psychrobacter sp. Ps6]MCG3879177.1 PAS domain-containing protein [Psychrobacter sp. Ps6]